MTTLAPKQKSNYRNLPRRHFGKDTKRRLVEEMLGGTVSIAQFARDNGIHPNQLMKWRREYFAGHFGVRRLAAPTETSPHWVEVAVSEVDAKAAVTLATTETAQRTWQSQPEPPTAPVSLRVSLRKGDLLLEGPCTLPMLRTVIEALQ